MGQQYKFLHFAFLLLFLTSCRGQPEKYSAESPHYSSVGSKIIGGGCDGCEIMYIGIPPHIDAVDTSAGWSQKGQKLFIMGTVFKPDGKTPAPDVVIYYWQTDPAGHYSPMPDMEAKAKKHGHLRGWMKTDKNGNYSLYTVRPAPYPNDVLPAHIHLSIKEPDLQNEYYTDEINFEDDPLLKPYLKKYPQENRGGRGVVSVTVKDGIQVAKHDIILGLNIPHYPVR